MTKVDYIQNFLDVRIRTLEKMDYDQLLLLQATQTEEVVLDEKKYSLMVFREGENSDNIRIILKLYRNYILGFCESYSVGIERSRNGSCRQLEGPELW